MKRSLIVLSLALLSTTAAAQRPTPPDPARYEGPISPDRLSADVRVLASDAFGGRAPGTPGETKTVDWLK